MPYWPGGALRGDAGQFQHRALRDLALMPRAIDVAAHLRNVRDAARRITEHDAHDASLQHGRRGADDVDRVQCPNHAALLEDADPVADGDGLMQLVGDEDDGESIGLDREQHLLQLGDALGCEHRGGLIQDEHPGSLPERLDDLDVLLLAQGQRAGAHIGVDA